MAAGEQLQHEPGDPFLALALDRGEAHAEEIELEVGAAADDLEVVLERRVGIGMADDDPSRIEALLLEDPELGEPDVRHDGVGRDGEARPAGRPGGGAVDAFLGRGEPRLVRADLADDARPDAGIPRPVGRLAHELVGEVVHGPPIDARLRRVVRIDTSRSP